MQTPSSCFQELFRDTTAANKVVGRLWLVMPQKEVISFLPSWEISICSSFVCLISNLWGSSAGTHHPRGRNYPCRDKPIPVYFCSLNYCESRAWWQQSRAVPGMHHAQHHPRDFCPTFLLAPLSALVAFIAAEIQDTSHLCVII